MKTVAREAEVCLSNGLDALPKYACPYAVLCLACAYHVALQAHMTMQTLDASMHVGLVSMHVLACPCMLVLGSTPTSQVHATHLREAYCVLLLTCEMQDDFGFGYIDGKQWEQFVVKFSAPPSPPNRFLFCWPHVLSSLHPTTLTHFQ
jgi:hypothetical protein